LSKSCLSCKKVVNQKLLTMCYFSIKSGEGGVGGEGGRAKSGSKAFGELLCSQPKAKRRQGHGQGQG
jgi:hypothetical protein